MEAMRELLNIRHTFSIVDNSSVPYDTFNFYYSYAKFNLNRSSSVVETFGLSFYNEKTAQILLKYFIRYYTEEPQESSPVTTKSLHFIYSIWIIENIFSRNSR